MPVSRTPSRRLPPIPRLPELDNWADHWVAVKDGKVIAASKTSADLAYQLRMIGPRAKGAVTEYVRPGREDAYFVGVG
jgi:hypothetical protein